MKSFYYVMIWTVLFICFGVYTNFEINKFTDKYIDEVKVIETYIEDDNYNIAKESLKSLSKSWHKEKTLWYKLLNHENFDTVCLYLNILEKGIDTKDKYQSLEYIQRIIMTLENILEGELCDLNHIM
ncbi:MAG: DUF4363 family protein [Peptostreptococcaceae bacterium]